MAEWTVQLTDNAALNDLWGALDHPDETAGEDTFYFSKKRIGQFNGLIVEVYSNEHPPPHFRVRYSGASADYRIDNCEQMNGDLGRHYHQIRMWHKRNKAKLIDAWDERRPSDCPVGRFRDDA